MARSMRPVNIPAGRLVLRDEGKPEVEIAIYRMGRREPLGAVMVPRDLLAWYAHVLLGAALVPADMVEKAAARPPAAEETPAVAPADTVNDGLPG